MAAGTLAERGFDVTLADKNEKTGKKLYITGKGRCNVTNECDGKEFLASVVSNPKFLMSAINAFDSYDTVDFLQKNGLNTVTERGNRVFPASQKSSDVIKTFTDYCRKNRVKMLETVGCVYVIVDASVFKFGVYFFCDYSVLNRVFHVADVAVAGDEHNAGKHKAHRKSNYRPHHSVGFARLFKQGFTKHFCSPFYPLIFV